MYMVAKVGSNGPMLVSTINFHKDLSDFFLVIHIAYVNYCKGVSSSDNREWSKAVLDDMTFRKFLTGWQCKKWKIYECVPNEVHRKTGKLMQPKNLWSNKKRKIALAEKFCGELNLDI